MKILIAPNAFKNSLSAPEVAMAIEEGMKKSKLTVECEQIPVADGGDGTLEVLYNIFGGKYFTENVKDPLGNDIDARWIKSGDKAFIEMAEASGIRLLNKNEYNPITTNSYGTGQLIIKALDQGAHQIVTGVGGSATVDGGTGILKALGAKFYDKMGDEINHGNFMNQLKEIDISSVDSRIYDVDIQVLCDVTNPLLGASGAVKVFGPQKGADPEKVEYLERAMIDYVGIVKKITQSSYEYETSTGAAGGISYMMKSFFNATFTSGAEYIIRESGMADKVKLADLIITGEGHLDSQSVDGKAPFMVGRLAKKHNKPCIALAGKWEDEAALYEVFTSLFTIVDGPVSLDEALTHAFPNVSKTCMQIGNTLAAALSVKTFS